MMKTKQYETEGCGPREGGRLRGGPVLCPGEHSETSERQTLEREVKPVCSVGQKSVDAIEFSWCISSSW